MVEGDSRFYGFDKSCIGTMVFSKLALCCRLCGIESLSVGLYELVSDDADSQGHGIDKKKE